jgi:sugar (pentulose or hexulose) kinase
VKPIQPLAAILLLAAPALARAQDLTAQPGESWLFRVAKGQPVAVHRVQPTTPPAPGEIRLTVKRMMGTTVTLLNNSAQAYTYRATLVGADGKAITARSCVLPANNRLAMESWPQVAAAVRIADFKPTRDSSCR